MSDSKTMSERLISEFAEGYMEKLFYFCLKKTGTNEEAEELTQDIAYQVIFALHNGIIPTSFSAWIWQIARNRFARWAKSKHIGRERFTGDPIEEMELADGSENVLDELIHKEQLYLLRRELAFIKSEYRDIVVAYYFENRSVRDIANSLSLSVSTVQQRLHRARNILKEGMNMAREFGVRSYKPEEVYFSKSGRDGKHGQPWTIVNHKLYKNIFLEVYENPQTAEALSLELGIALPYIEDELEYLVREQLLTKSGNKYQTAFPIISKEEQLKMHESNMKVQKTLTDKICELIDTYIHEGGLKVNYSHIGYDAAKWALLVRTFDYFQWSYDESAHNVNMRVPYPERPDEGAWVLTGFEATDLNAPSFVGRHGYMTYESNEIRKDINFWQYKFRINNIYEKTPDFISWQEAYTLWLVCTSRAEACEKAHIEKLLEYGYLTNKGAIAPNVLIFDDAVTEYFDENTKDKLTALKNDIYSLFKQAPEISRGYVVEQALQDGWIKYDHNTVKTVGAYIYL